MGQALTAGWDGSGSCGTPSPLPTTIHPPMLVLSELQVLETPQSKPSYRGREHLTPLCTTTASQSKQRNGAKPLHFIFPVAGSMGENRGQGHRDPEMSYLTWGLG